MEENLHKDNLEDFFKKSFDDENPEPSDDQWDVPSDAVWSGINKKISSSEVPASVFNFKRLMAIAAGILILFLVYYNYTLQKQVAQLKELVEIQENKINELTTEKQGNGSSENGGLEDRGKEETTGERLEKSDFETSQNSSQTGHFQNDQRGVPEQQAAEHEISHKSAQLNNQPVENSNKQKAVANDNLIVKAAPNEVTEMIDLHAIEPITEGQNQKNTASYKPESESNSVVLAPLPAKVTLAEVNGKPQEIKLIPLPATETAFETTGSALTQTGFYAGVHIAPTYSYRNVKSVDGPVLRRLLNEKEQADYSVALGLKAGYQFSKNWSVETGLNYYKNTVQSLHRAQVRYERQLERLNGDGDYDSNYRLNLSTSYGEIETDVALTRSASTAIDQNDYINLVLKTNQELKYLGVPVALRYRTTGNKFHFSAKAGVSANFILQKDVTIQAAQVKRTGVHHRRTIVDKKFEGLKNTTFDFMFGIGADYDLSTNWSIYFEPVVTHSLSPVYNLNGKIKTYPIVASLNIGLSYKF